MTEQQPPMIVDATRWTAYRSVSAPSVIILVGEAHIIETNLHITIFANYEDILEALKEPE